MRDFLIKLLGGVTAHERQCFERRIEALKQDLYLEMQATCRVAEEVGKQKEKIATIIGNEKVEKALKEALNIAIHWRGKAKAEKKRTNELSKSCEAIKALVLQAEMKNRNQSATYKVRA